MDLYSERLQLLKENRALLDQAIAENRDLDGIEQETYEKRDARIDELGKMIERENKLSAQNAVVSTPVERKLPETSGIPASRDEFRAALGAFARSGELRAGFGSTVSSEGGFTIFPDHTASLITTKLPPSIMRQYATVITTSSNTVQLPVLSTFTGIAATAEKAQAPTGTATFSSPSITIYKAAVTYDVPNELLADSQYDVESELLNIVNTGFDQIENTWFVSGTGTGMPQGVALGASLGITTAGPTTILPDEVLGVVYTVPEQYSSNATWLMHDNTILAVRKLKDSQGRYLWEPALAAGQPDRLLGYPLRRCNAMDQIATGKTVAVFGNLADYYIADRAGISVIRDPYTQAGTGQTRFTITKRMGGTTRLNVGIKTLKMA